MGDIDLEIHKLEEKLSKYQKVKQGMMEELLTGKADQYKEVPVR